MGFLKICESVGFFFNFERFVLQYLRLSRDLATVKVKILQLSALRLVYSTGGDRMTILRLMKICLALTFKRGYHSCCHLGQGYVQYSNKENRKKLRYPHIVGKTSFAIIREEKKKETSGALSSKDFFVATRRRKPDRVYKESYEDTSNKIAEMERMETLESEDGTQISVDTFAAVIGPDHPGRVRLYGREVTKTLLKQKAGDSGSSTNVAAEEMVKKRMGKMEEKIQQVMLKKFNVPKDAIKRDVTMKIIAQL